MDNATTEKINKFVRDNDNFNDVAWNKVKETIPQDQREAADAKVRADLKK